MLSQLRNICSALCIAASPWEQGATSDKQSQEILKTTETVWCSIPVKHPGRLPRLQGLSTASIHTNPNYCTVTLVSTEQLSHSLALMGRFGSVYKNSGLLKLWNKMQILKYVKRQGGTRSFCRTFHGAPTSQVLLVGLVMPLQKRHGRSRKYPEKENKVCQRNENAPTDSK